MYYPIIDKLKELMADITSVKEKEPLVIEGTVTSQSGGTWVGKWSDVESAFNTNKPIYFTIIIEDIKYLVPVISIDSGACNSVIMYFAKKIAYGSIYSNNTFTLTYIL